MGIMDILGRTPSKSNDGRVEDGYYRCIIGLCTKTANDVLRGKIDVSLPGRFNTKARFVECVDCGLIDCLLRGSLSEDFKTGTRCPRCGGEQKRKL
jgi:hypothetical protein